MEQINSGLTGPAVGLARLFGALWLDMIFINYRREDSAATAGRLHDWPKCSGGNASSWMSARGIADMFKNTGYDVTTAFNVGYLDFKRTIRKFDDTASNADIAVIYYAGYGLKIHGTNY